MKKFIKKVIFFSVFCAVISIVPSYLIDPYNVFHWENIRNNGVEPNTNYIKTKYIIENPDNYDGFLLGSSRVGSIHVENIPDVKIYNMTYSAGTPEENYQTLKTFIENNVNVEYVYMGVDSLSYTEDPEKHITQGFRAPYEYLEHWKNFLNLYLNPAMVVQSLPTILQRKDNAGMECFYEYGWWCDYDRTTTIDFSNVKPSMGLYYRLEETLQDIQNIKDLCENNGIKLVVFTNPMYKITYEASVEINYLEFLERLANITGFYNFSGINDITVNTDNYIDASHYNAYVGDILIDIIFNGNVDEKLYEQGFGWYVTKENINDFLEILKFRGSEEHKVNSPWNIAADFDVRMSLGRDEIAGMLSEYEEDCHTGMDIHKMAGLLYDYTSGYPVLVSRLCWLMDEKVSTMESLINIKCQESERYRLGENYWWRLLSDADLDIWKAIAISHQASHNFPNGAGYTSQAPFLP